MSPVSPLPAILSVLLAIATALLVRSEAFRTFAASRPAWLIVPGALVAAVGFFASAFEACALIRLSVAFILTACGNTLFGAPTAAPSRLLGEVAYGIYLLHGILLFVLFNFVIGIPGAAALSVTAHRLPALGVTPILVLICYVTFRTIDSPAMPSTNGIAEWLRLRYASRTSEDVARRRHRLN